MDARVQATRGSHWSLVVAALVLGGLVAGLAGPASATPTGPVGLSDLHPSSNYSLVATVGAGICPTAAGYDSGTNEVYIGNSCSNNVTVISAGTNLVVNNISVHPDPEFAKYDPAKKEMFIADSADSKVDIIADSNHTVVHWVTINAAFGLAYDPVKGEMFVADPNLDQVVVLNDTTDSPVAVVNVGGEPEGMTYDAQTGQIFVTNYATNNVSVISDGNNTVVGTVALTVSPYDAAFDPTSGDIYVTSTWGVTVVSGTNLSVLGTVPGMGTAGPITDGANVGKVFVASRGGNNVTVVSTSTNTISQVVNVGNGPDAIAYDPTDGDVYTANYNDGTASVVSPGAPPTYAVTFTESGLPAGTSWTVTAGGTPQTSTTSSIVFQEPNGSHSYTVGAVSGYAPSPSGGTVTVAGAAISQSIAFTSTVPTDYTLTFTESGLPADTPWSVTLQGSTQSSSTTTNVFSVPNGTYPFSLGTVTGFVASPASGHVTVSGAAQDQAITFSVAAPTQYTVTFTETGLPAGSTWQVTLNGSTQSTSTTGTSFTLPDGTYTYTDLALVDYAPVPSTGTVTVSGGPVTTPIVFYELFPVSFTAPGLPAGTNFSVTVTPQSAGIVLAGPLTAGSVTRWSDGGAEVHFTVSNGTYSYASSADGYVGVSSTITVAGVAPGSVPITYTSTSTTSTSSSASTFPFLEVGVIVVVVMVIVVVVAVVLLRRGKPKAPSPP